MGPWQVPVSHPVGSGHPQVRPGGMALRPHSVGCTGLSLSCPEAKLSAAAAVPSPPSAQHPWSFKTHHVPQEPCLAPEADPAWESLHPCEQPTASPDTALPSFLPRPCSSQEAPSCMEGPPARGTASQPSVL